MDYNFSMETATVKGLLHLNQVFYQSFGSEFSRTRGQIQPGVRRVVESLGGEERILDLGCGNGSLGRALADRGHRGDYLGLDISLPLLKDAGGTRGNIAFAEADLAGDWEKQAETLTQRPVDIVTAFAVLHHIPGMELRVEILRKIRKILDKGGRFIHSEWQFLASEKLRKRVQPWEKAGFSPAAVDAGDFLLDWHSGGNGLRYVHHFDEEELKTLARASGFQIHETFFSDGEGGRLSLYQNWEVI